MEVVRSLGSYRAVRTNIDTIVRKHETSFSSLPVIATCTTLPCSGDFPVYEEDDSELGQDDAASSISAMGDSIFEDEEQEMGSTGSAPHEGAAAVNSRSQSIFTKAIAVAQLAEAAMLIHARLPAEPLLLLGLRASTSRVVSGVAARLRVAMAAPLHEEESSCSDFQGVVQLLRSMKLTFDEETATAKLLAAIAVLEERLSATPRAPRARPEEKPELIALHAAAEHAFAELAGLSALLLPKILHRFARMSPSTDVDKGNVLMAKVFSCAKLVEATFKAAAALSKMEPHGCSAIGHEDIALFSAELRELSATLLPKVCPQAVGSLPKEPAWGINSVVLNIATGIAEGVESYMMDKMERMCMGALTGTPAHFDGSVFGPAGADPLEEVLQNAATYSGIERSASAALGRAVALAAVVLGRPGSV
mmetsp:Transcript_22375/g.59062  ORF Transcript_22375/g.59062 Transcript_22375/m.59062 type:complete len:421 (-) Transcript_22375:301-1563(-)